jgi:hypothetical protein
MPAFRDIDPVAIGQRLRYVWAWKYVREPDDFINRLAGEEIVHALGKAPRGLKMTEFFDPEVYRTFLPRHLRVVQEPAFSGQPFISPPQASAPRLRSIPRSSTSIRWIDPAD